MKPTRVGDRGAEFSQHAKAGWRDVSRNRHAVAVFLTVIHDKRPYRDLYGCTSIAGSKQPTMHIRVASFAYAMPLHSLRHFGYVFKAPKNPKATNNTLSIEIRIKLHFPSHLDMIYNHMQCRVLAEPAYQHVLETNRADVAATMKGSRKRQTYAQDYPAQ
ncbi:hypothetical protein MFRU_010g02680 [Monilinia fructicola]|nr:hypothetical protein MFRU_010g02680 [Monilinia fructicola]